MTADDHWGHTYIDPRGKVFSEKDYPANWVIHYHFSENDGWTYMRHGPQRRILLRISPYTDFSEAEGAIENYKLALAKKKKPDEHEKRIFKGLERMIKGKSKELEINDF